MRIYIVVKEMQNDHGFIDTCLVDGFTTQETADKAITDYENEDLEAGEAVEGRADEWKDQEAAQRDGDAWTVSYRWETVTLYRAPATSIESQVYIDTGELPIARIR